MLFSDQVSILSSWFKGWNECEQTVALFSLLKRVKKRQAKFLARCLEHGLKDCMELIPVEQEANNIAFINRLMGETDQKHVISILLSHLPLLRPGNDEVKSRYLELLPRVLTFAVERSVCLRESRQLLSYSLIHPAFDNDERSSLTSWMEHLEDRIPDVDHDSNCSGEGSQDDTQKPEDMNRNQQWKNIPDLSRAYGIPQVNSPSWQSRENKYAANTDPESLPQGIGRSDSEGDFFRADAEPTGDDSSHSSEYDFGPWLKSLRLHKYKDLFANMTYDDMMDLTEEKLAKENVTKGARDKILLNVRRLHERFERLKILEKELSSGGSLKSALTELKSMVYTPITRFDPPPDDVPRQTANLTPGERPKAGEIQSGDIPAQFSKVMGKACTQLLISKPDKDNISSYMHVLEKCIQHTAFSAQQKKRLVSWKSQINKMYRSLPKTQQAASQRNAMGANYSGRRVTNRSLPAFGVRMASPSQPILQASNQSLFADQVTKPGWYSGNFGGSNTGPAPHSMQLPIGVARKTASLDPSLVQRPTYPSNQPLDGTKPGIQPGVDSDFSQNLDSLCHSVAEHALADDGRISTL